MFRNSKAIILTIVAVVAFGMIGWAIAQESQPAGDRGGRGNRGQRDPAQAQQRMEQFRQQAAERLKEELAVNDEEWTVLQPKIEKVQTLARESRPNMGFGRGGRRGQDGGDSAPPPPQTEVERKHADLQQVLTNKDAKPEQIKSSLTAYREARTKAREALEKAQKDLKEVLTVRQEAVLVSYGVLD